MLLGAHSSGKTPSPAVTEDAQLPTYRDRTERSERRVFISCPLHFSPTAPSPSDAICVTPVPTGHYIHRSTTLPKCLQAPSAHPSPGRFLVIPFYLPACHWPFFVSPVLHHPQPLLSPFPLPLGQEEVLTSFSLPLGQLDHSEFVLQILHRY